MLFRMKYIDRWALMRNTRKETLAEHTLETAFIAHAIAVIHNKRFNGNVDEGQVALAAMFHDAPEILTGDMPTPVKYCNERIKESYKEIEAAAEQRLLDMLPEDMRPTVAKAVVTEDETVKKIVKAADKISALIKCRDELSFGNRDFKAAEKQTAEAVKQMAFPAADAFLEEFLSSFSLSLDDQSTSLNC